MAKVRVDTATGKVLDWLVAKCEGVNPATFILYYEPVDRKDYDKHGFPEFHYSTVWYQGGPILERQKIATVYRDEKDDWEVPNWSAWPTQADDRTEVMGETKLVAGLRCHVIQTLGYELEVPDELVKDTQ